jgi:hypothetical protein
MNQRKLDVIHRVRDYLCRGEKAEKEFANPYAAVRLDQRENVHWSRRCRRSGRLLAHSLNSLQFALIRAHRSIQILVFAGVIRPATAIADPIMALNHPPEPLRQRASPRLDCRPSALVGQNELIA